MFLKVHQNQKNLPFNNLLFFFFSSRVIYFFLKLYSVLFTYINKKNDVHYNDGDVGKPSAA